jgi:hypothetical protein
MQGPRRVPYSVEGVKDSSWLDRIQISLGLQPH